MTHNLSYPTVSNQFHRRETSWRDRREQATPVLNKILDELVKQSNWTQQRICFSKCRDQNVTGNPETIESEGTERNHD